MTKLRLLAALLALAVGFSPAPVVAYPTAAPAEQPARTVAPLPAAPVVHLLAVADSNDGRIGPDVETDARNVIAALDAAFKAAKKSDQFRHQLLLGEKVTAGNVRATLKRMGVRPQDTVVVFVSGHGEIDDLGRHRLQMADNGRLNRQDLLDDMAALRPRLAVLLTDVCSGYTTRQAGVPVVKPEAAVALPRGPVIPWATVENLFLSHTGVVDVTAAEPGFLASVEPVKPGSFFTNAFLQVLAAPRANLMTELDHNRDGAIQWKELLPQMRAVAAQRQTDAAPAGSKPRRPQQAFDWAAGTWAGAPAR